MTDLVSILIPAFNAENWIHDCVSSAMAQTWPRREIIVVDDGSSDKTLEIARGLESGVVKVVTQENTGACGARNKALSLAQGDYIQWLDADDLLHPEKIARQLKRADSGQQSRVLLTCAWGKFFIRHEKARFERDSLWQDWPAVEWIVTKFANNVWMNPAVWLVSRRLTDLAGPWDERLASSGDDDGEYVCRVVAASSGVKFVPDARCYYRVGTVGSLNWNMERSERGLEALVLSLRLSIEHLLRLENSERTRRASLQLLQTFMLYFYASDERLIASMIKLADELGGDLRPPRAGWKYYPLETVVGPRVTKKVMNNWRAAKLLARRRVDWYLDRMAR